MKKTNFIRFAPVIGLGYWITKYKGQGGLYGKCYNIILPFLFIQFGYFKELGSFDDTGFTVPDEFDNTHHIDENPR